MLEHKDRPIGPTIVVKKSAITKENRGKLLGGSKIARRLSLFWGKAASQKGGDREQRRGGTHWFTRNEVRCFRVRGQPNKEESESVRGQ